MTNFQAAYIPIGVPTFHLESAREEFRKSAAMLKALTPDVICPAEPLLTVNDLKDFLKNLNPDLIILQNTTFANAAYAGEILRAFQSPVLLWTLREPVIDGGRLRLNSLTGAYSAGNLFHHMGRANFEYVFGSPEEDRVVGKISAVIRAARVKKILRGLNMAGIGHTPQGFGFGRALDAELLRRFGVNLISVEARELMSKARSYNQEDYSKNLEEAKSKMVGLEKLPAENVDAMARLSRAYEEFIETNQIRALASRCWPDFFVDFGTPVCAVLGLLNDRLLAAACESDLMGALSLFIGIEFSGSPAFFGDPVSLDERNNTVTFWHCGAGACALARQDTGPEAGVHPNRKIGPTMEFGCKPADRITVFRIGRTPEGEFRFFIARGKALDVPKQFSGTSVVVQTESNSREVVERSVKDGWEPHFAAVYGDIAEELETLANLLEIKVFKY